MCVWGGGEDRGRGRIGEGRIGVSIGEGRIGEGIIGVGEDRVGVASVTSAVKKVADV